MQPTYETDPFPTNWDRGFQYPYRVGAGGTERPFLRRGEWVLRVWNAKDRRHELYHYRTDLFSPDVENWR
jgi:hypothetical protein